MNTQIAIKGPQANTLGFNWTPETILCVLQLRDMGMPRAQIARVLTEKMGRRFSRASIDYVVQQYGSLQLVREPEEIKTYQELTLPMDDYIISCDYHAPFYSALWVNRLLMIAVHFGIKKHIIVGDLFDMEFASHYPPQDGQQKPSFDTELAADAPLMRGFNYFDEIIVLNGNHERRIGLLTESRIQARHLNLLLGGDVWKNKVVFSEFDKLKIDSGDPKEPPWFLIHPKSYSRISGSKAVSLTHKHHGHVLNAHGHFTAIRWDASGDYRGIDIGGLFDVTKIPYKQCRTTDHPEWNPGFGMLLNEHFYLFDNSTDWDFWLGHTRPNLARIQQGGKR